MGRGDLPLSRRLRRQTQLLLPSCLPTTFAQKGSWEEAENLTYLPISWLSLGLILLISLLGPNRTGQAEHRRTRWLMAPVRIGMASEQLKRLTIITSYASPRTTMCQDGRG